MAVQSTDIKSGNRLSRWGSSVLAFFDIKFCVAFFGLGIAFCWCYATQRLICNDFGGRAQVAQYFGTALMCVIICIISCIIKRNCSTDTRTIVIGLIVVVASAPFIIFQGVWASSEPIVLILAGISGIVISWLYMMWGQFFSRLSIRQALFCTCGVAILATIIKIFIDLLDHNIVSIILVAALPFISVACWGYSWPQFQNASPAPERFDRKNFGDLRNVYIGVALMAMGAGMFMSFADAVFALPFYIRIIAHLTTIAVAIGVLIYIKRSSSDLNVFTLWFAVVVVIATGLAIGILLGVPLGYPSSAIFTTTQMMVIMFWWAILADISHNTREHSDLVYGIGWGVIYALPMGIGLLLPTVLPTSFDMQSMAVVVIWILLLALLFFRVAQSADLHLFLDLNPRISDETTEELRARFDAFISELDITQREKEIIALYAQGRSRAFISSQLIISENTVRDHLKSAYRKLGVHTKQELIDLINEGITR